MLPSGLGCGVPSNTNSYFVPISIPFHSFRANFSQLSRALSYSRPTHSHPLRLLLRINRILFIFCAFVFSISCRSLHAYIGAFHPQLPPRHLSLSLLIRPPPLDVSLSLFPSSSFSFLPLPFIPISLCCAITTNRTEYLVVRCSPFTIRFWRIFIPHFSTANALAARIPTVFLHASCSRFVRFAFGRSFVLLRARQQ